MAEACPACGAEHVPEARFCSSCGAALRRACPHCGADMAAAASFCSSCGAALRPGAERAAAADEREERRVVTVLFADLAGSTALGERLDPEDVRELQGELYDLADAAVRRFGGVTEKFVGDAVMAVFGIPQTHEDDAERAVRAALAVRDGFAAFADRVEERHGVRLGLRLGVDTGEVVAGREAAARGELMVTGDAVNVAARLQQRAEPGEILVGERTHTATSRVVAYEPRGAATAKGKADPVSAWAVVEVVGGPGQRPAAGLAAPLVGREEELAMLTALAARVEQERSPRLVTVFGQAGVGKSRLVAEFVQRLPEARLLKGRCLPYGDGITYWPLAEALKGHAAVLDTDSAQVASAKLRAAVEATVAPEHSERVLEAMAWTIGLDLPPAGLESEEVRRRLHDAWTRLFAGLGRERLTLLAVEDIHWASEPLLELLERLADTPEETALLVLCPSRPELLDARPTWTAGRANATALTLSPLSPDEAARLAEGLLGAGELPSGVARAVLERAGGNPFFVEEILRMLIDRGALARRNGGWAATAALADVPLPDSVHGVIAARIDLLDFPARDALRRCAVVGRAFWPRAVEADEDVIAALARRGLVLERPASSMAGMREFTFKHALTRDVAYGALPRHERRRWHAHVAAWIQQTAPGREAEMAEVAAYHLEQAIAYGETSPAVKARANELLVQAAEAAIARAAIGPATQLAERAIAHAPDGDGRSAALLVAARADLAAERYDRAGERLAEAETLAATTGDAERRADLLGWSTRVSWLTGRWDEAHARATEATRILEGLPESYALATALARRSQIEMLRGLPEADEHARLAVEVGERTGNRVAAVNARINLFSARALDGVQPSAAEMEQAVQEAVDAGAYDEGYRAIVNYVWSADGWVGRDALERAVEAAHRHLRDYDPPESYGRYLELSLALFVYVPTGRWTAVDAVVAANEDTLRIGSNRLVWLTLAGGMSLRRGDLAAAQPSLEELRRGALASDEPQRVAPMAAVVVPLAAVKGDLEAVREVVTAALDLLDGRRTRALAATFALPIARALWRSGELDLLRRLEGLAEDPAVACVPLARTMARGARGHLALLERRPQDGVALLEEARRGLAAQGRLLDAACVDDDLALAYAALGDEDRAAASRARADAYLAPLGCVNPY